MNATASKLRTVAVLMLCVLGALGSGCSGINATKSISPLDFLLPGLLRNDMPQEPLNNDNLRVALNQAALTSQIDQKAMWIQPYEAGRWPAAKFVFGPGSQGEGPGLI